MTEKYTTTDTTATTNTARALDFESALEHIQSLPGGSCVYVQQSRIRIGAGVFSLLTHCDGRTLPELINATTHLRQPRKQIPAFLCELQSRGFVKQENGLYYTTSATRAGLYRVKPLNPAF